MCCKRWIVMWAILAAGVVGCQKSEGTPGAAVPAANGGAATADAEQGQANPTPAPVVARLDGPAAAVFEFLEAVRTGNDAKATQMLSTVAREKTAALNRSVRPSASDTARFQIGKVEYRAEDLAAVHCTWTDLDEKGEGGEPQTDEAVWMARREPQGWRIAGAAFTVFPGEPPLLLNFEEPEEMLQKQQWVRDEIRRRQQAELQAQGQESPPKPLRR